MGELEHLAIQSVGFKYRGAGRMVYPGLAQLSSFIAMNSETHSRAFIDKIFNEARGTASEGDRHNRFYDEYLAVMDMTAEFYLSTVDRIFKKLEIAQNRFSVNGKPVDIGKITDVAIMTVEGTKDDISALASASLLWICAPASRPRRNTSILNPARAITASSPASPGVSTSARWSWTSSTNTWPCRTRSGPSAAGRAAAVQWMSVTRTARWASDREPATPGPGCSCEDRITRSGGTR